jgi:hypothetical protein
MILLIYLYQRSKWIVLKSAELSILYTSWLCYEFKHNTSRYHMAVTDPEWTLKFRDLDEVIDKFYIWNKWFILENKKIIQTLKEHEKVMKERRNDTTI